MYILLSNNALYKYNLICNIIQATYFGIMCHFSAKFYEILQYHLIFSLYAMFNMIFVPIIVSVILNVAYRLNIKLYCNLRIVTGC
jgi:hypothetical protein